MVRNYKRKTCRANWSEEQMRLAILSVESKELSIRKAAVAFGVPKYSLNRRVRGKLRSLSAEEKHKNILERYRAILTHAQEKELAEHIINMDQAFYGLSINDIRTIVYDYCQRNNIKNNFNADNKMAGRDFVEGFMKRHPNLSLRRPESVSMNHVFGLNKSSVNLYFHNLESVLDKHNFKPHEIFNCDESGLTCVHKPVKVVAPKGKRCVSSVTSGERGQTTTIVVACSASGTYIPPMMIFKRKRNRPELVDHAPAGTVACCSPNGWIDADLFLIYLKHFVSYTKCSKDAPVLLILDGHKTHTKILSTIEYARENGVVILSLPPHTSHKLQPLDRSFFKPLKSAFNSACSTWLRNHPGHRITVDQLGELFNAAYLKAATMENAVSGFRCTGIVPFNKEILPSSAFLEDPRVVDPPADETFPSPAEAAKQITSNNQASFEEQAEESCPATVETTPVPPVSTETASSPTEEPPSSNQVSFSEIMKLPSLTEKKKSKRSEESRIITSSPYKKSLVEKIAEQERTKRAAKTKSVKQQPKPKKAKTAAKNMAKAKNACADIVEDSQCPMCDGFWSESLPGEDWVQCCDCKKWLHEECCCSVTPTTVICDICYDN